MKGSVRSMGDAVWRLRFEVGFRPDGKRDQRMITFHGTKKQAQQKLRDLLTTIDGDTFIEPQKLTLGQWLTEWQTNVLAGRVRASTFKRYAGIIRNHILKASLAAIPIQKLRPSHIEHYYATCGVRPQTLPQHHVILHSALKKAVKEKLLSANPATDVEKAPRRKRGKTHEGHLPCWSAEDARKFLNEAKKRDPQTAALFTMALDTGARKSELLGLKWVDVDLDRATIRIHQQLTKQPGQMEDGSRRDPEWGPTKSGRERVISIAAETVELLRSHRRSQSKVKMANRTVYHDFGLVFAKEWGDAYTRKSLLGDPLQGNNIGERAFLRLIEEAVVPVITFHGMRHTCATLLLMAGEPIHVVSQRLGHSDVSITWNTYSHVLPNQQKQAAARLAALLHG